MNENIKVFEAEIASGYKLLGETEFSTEKQMQRDIEANLDIFFQNLKFLGSEVTIGGDRVDTVAYDRNKNCFVIIEYKNDKSESVLNQCIAYQQKMKDHKTDLVLLYNEDQKKHQKSGDFNWGSAYVVIISPKFTRYQIQGKDSLHNIELYKISTYDNGILILDHLNDKPIKGEIEQEEETNIDPRIEKIYHELKEKIHDKIKVTEYQTQNYLGFYLPNNPLVCGLVARKNRVDVLYMVKKSANVLSESEFVKAANHPMWGGGGEYMSQVRDRSDIEKAILHIQKVHDYKKYG